MPMIKCTKSKASVDRFERRDWMVGLVGMVARCVLCPRFKIVVQGAGQLPRQGSFLLLPKHQRWVDIPLLGLATPRPLYYIAKAELFAGSGADWFIKSLGGIPLNRQRPIESRRYLQRTEVLLQRGNNGVVIFPEGTYVVGRVGPGRTGVLKFILSRLRLPCIPVGIRYSEEGRRTRVRIRFGSALLPEENGPTASFVEDIMERISALSDLPRNSS
jgi:1-acyl-sn-glycerol-3-phosphate acyltransferase